MLIENIVREEECPDIGPRSFDNETAETAQDDVKLLGELRQEVRLTSGSDQTPGSPKLSIKSPPARSIIL